RFATDPTSSQRPTHQRAAPPRRRCRFASGARALCSPHRSAPDFDDAGNLLALAVLASVRPRVAGAHRHEGALWWARAPVVANRAPIVELHVGEEGPVLILLSASGVPEGAGGPRP